MFWTSASAQSYRICNCTAFQKNQASHSGTKVWNWVPKV